MKHGGRKTHFPLQRDAENSMIQRRLTDSNIRTYISAPILESRSKKEKGSTLPSTNEYLIAFASKHSPYGRK